MSAQLSRRMVLLGLASGITATTAYALTPRRAEHRLANLKLDELIPIDIGPWRFGSNEGVVVARPEEAYGTDGYDQVVARTYEAAGLPSVMLLIAYGSTQGATLQLHRPETCYPAQGFRLSNFSTPDLHFAPTSPVHMRRFTATRENRVERLIYWTRIAESFPRNTAGEYRAILGSVLQGIVPDGVLVRVSTLTPDLGTADEALAAFVPKLVGSTSRAGRQILLGDTIAAEIEGKGATRKG